MATINSYNIIDSKVTAAAVLYRKEKLDISDDKLRSDGLSCW